MSFLNSNWSKGFKIVNCGSRKLFHFLRAAVGKCGDLCPGAKLKVICSSKSPLRERSIETALYEVVVYS